KEIEHTFRNDRPDFGDNTALFVDFAFRGLGETGFDQSFGDFLSRLLVAFGFVISEDVAEKFRTRYVLDRLMETRKVRCRRLADVWNRERIKPAREREGPRAFNRLDRFGCVLLAEDAGIFLSAEVQLRKLLDLQLEQVERLTHQAPLHHFIGNESADAFNI